jgi:hypothetical protein
MRLFSGPNPVFLKKTGFGPQPSQISIFDVCYTQPPVVGFDVISPVEIDNQDLSLFEVYYEPQTVVGFQAYHNKDDAEVAFYASMEANDLTIVGFGAEEEEEIDDSPQIQSFEVFYCHSYVVGFEVETETQFSDIVAFGVKDE